MPLLSKAEQVLVVDTRVGLLEAIDFGLHERSVHRTGLAVFCVLNRCVALQTVSHGRYHNAIRRSITCSASSYRKRANVSGVH